jgi:hypothetical protein
MGKVQKTITVNGKIYHLTDSVPTTGEAHWKNNHLYAPKNNGLSAIEIVEKIRGVFLDSQVACLESQYPKLEAMQFALAVKEELNDGWVPNWGDPNTSKFSIGINASGEPYVTNHKEYRVSIAHFKDWKTANKAIKVIGKRRISLVVS